MNNEDFAAWLHVVGEQGSTEDINDFLLNCEDWLEGSDTVKNRYKTMVVAFAQGDCDISIVMNLESVKDLLSIDDVTAIVKGQRDDIIMRSMMDTDTTMKLMTAEGNRLKVLKSAVKGTRLYDLLAIDSFRETLSPDDLQRLLNEEPRPRIQLSIFRHFSAYKDLLEKLPQELKDKWINIDKDDEEGTVTEKQPTIPPQELHVPEKKHVVESKVVEQEPFGPAATIGGDDYGSSAPPGTEKEDPPDDRI